MPGNYRKGPLFVSSSARPKVKPRWNWSGMLWRAFKRTVMAFGVFFLGIIILTVIVSVAVINGNLPTEPLPSKFVLSMTIDSDYPEYQLASYPLASGGPTMLQVINALDHAGRDTRVKGLVVDLEGAEIGLGHLEELRAALVRFRKSGKFAYVYAPSYGEPGRGLGTYYLASVFSEIWMQPVGALSMSGISAEMPFARELLDKIGVQPQFFARKEYKSLFESFNNREMSPASREEMTSLLKDISDHLIDGIAQAKGMKPEQVRALMDKGIFTDKEALAAGLVTKVEGYDVLRDRIRLDVNGTKTPAKTKVSGATTPKALRKAADEGLFVDIDRYALDNKKDLGTPGFTGKKKRAALVYVNGTIASDPSSRPNAFGSSIQSGENITDDLLAIADDPDIDIVVIRINSPGGSPTAAETIRRAAMRCKQNGKKIVISMGNEAASGGYWIAAAGDYIFALPGTLTGSIGVAGGKFALTGLWAKLGINWQSVDMGQNAGMWSFNRPFSESATERMNAMMDQIYDSFIALVAQSRHMTITQADNVARGRVWTGRQGKDHGLVDDLGGLDTALDYAAAQIGVKDRTHMNLEIFPRPQSPFQKLEDLAGQVRAGGWYGGGTQALSPVLQELDRAIKASQYLTYQPLTVR